MKVFELAKELNITPKELITFFKDNEYKVSSHMQKLDDELIDFARNNFVKEDALKEDVPEDNKKFKVEEMLAEGKNVILEIETVGAEKVMEKCHDTTSIYLVPPSMEELEHRLRGRGTESEEKIQKRIETAKSELLKLDKFKYVVTNDEIVKTTQQIKEIILKEINISE